jgi:hypothetical protein
MRLKLLVVALTATCAVSATALTGVASAEWQVAGAEPSGGTAALASTAKVGTAFVLAVPSEKVKVTCKGTQVRGTGLELSEPETLAGKSLVFEGCETTEPASNCTLVGQPISITSNAIVGTVTPFGGSAGEITIENPSKGAAIASLPFSGTNTCGFKTKESLAGSVTVNAPTLQESLTSQPIEALGSSENNSLEMASKKTYLEAGSAQFKLPNNSKFQDKPVFNLSTALVNFGNQQKLTLSAGVMVEYTALREAKIDVLETVGGEGVFSRKSEMMCINATLLVNQKCKVEVDFKPTNPVIYRGAMRIGFKAPPNAAMRTEVAPFLEGTGTP